MRKVRLGLAVLGWPANDLLKHGRERILYGVPLVRNLRDYGLGVVDEPEYLFDVEASDTDLTVSRWWIDRWALKRVVQPTVRASIASNSRARLIDHGARVPLPPGNGQPLF